MKVNLYDKKGNKSGDTTLPKEIFGIDPNLEIVKQYLHVFKTNQRQGNASTKTRGEVSGSGAKPFAQKHTGRARAGEKRNPIWRHGGIAHGPKPKDWSLSMPTNMKNYALVSVLAMLQSKGRISVTEPFEFETFKTKEAKEYLKSTGIKGKTLVLLGKGEKNSVTAFRNIKNISTALVTNVNVYQLMNTKNLLMEASALEFLKDKYFGESEK